MACIFNGYLLPPTRKPTGLIYCINPDCISGKSRESPSRIRSGQRGEETDVNRLPYGVLYAYLLVSAGDLITLFRPG